MHASIIAQAQTLVGRKIVAVRWMTRGEAEESLWNHRSPILVLDDGSYIGAQSDDEGNDAGALFTQKFILPVDR